MLELLALILAAMIWGLIIKVAAWSFGFTAPFLGASLIGFFICALINAIRRGR